jgi:hypothetical protein
VRFGGARGNEQLVGERPPRYAGTEGSPSTPTIRA